MDPGTDPDESSVLLPLELQVSPALLRWLDGLQQDFGLRSREGLVVRLLETLAGESLND